MEADDTSWEDVTQLIKDYPDIDLEYKVKAYERGIVTLPVNLVNKEMVNGEVRGGQSSKENDTCQRSMRERRISSRLCRYTILAEELNIKRGNEEGGDSLVEVE